jgi:signal transduction histidine kinase
MTTKHDPLGRLTKAELLRHIKRLERQLRKADKQLARCEVKIDLAGTMAHDLNTLLSVIIGFAEMAVEDANDPDESRSDLAEILKAAERAKNMVARLQQFHLQM